MCSRGPVNARLGFRAAMLAAFCVLLSESGLSSASGSGPGSGNPNGVLAAVRSAVTELCDSAYRNLLSVVGKQTVETTLEWIQVAIRVLSEGAASGLNVIAVYITEILKAAGINVQLPFPQFTPEGVATVSQWALLALIGYWLLSLILRLAFSLIRRVLWMLKLCAVLWLFMLIMSDTSASRDTTAWRLAGLVVVCVLLGLGRAKSEGDRCSHLESRLKSLELRLKEVEHRRKKD
ncbi:transmembrane protein 109 isoform X2 [Arapaima gigas]